MKNPLEKFAEENAMNSGKVMNLLQENGVVSDNAIELSEVAEADFPAAKDFLKKYLPKSKRN